MKLDIQNDGLSYMVRISGELDTATANEFTEMVAEAAGAKGAEVSIDCSELEYLSSKGIRVILSFQQEVIANGGRFTLLNIRDSVKDILQLTGLYDSLCK